MRLELSGFQKTTQYNSIYSLARKSQVLYILYTNNKPHLHTSTATIITSPNHILHRA
jgi:hypothetical protein